MVKAEDLPGRIGCLIPAVLVSFSGDEIDVGDDLRMECFLHFLEHRRGADGHQRLAYWIDSNGDLEGRAA
jgi:hypothetical protein